MGHEWSICSGPSLGNIGSVETAVSAAKNKGMKYTLPKTAKFRTHIDVHDPKCVKEWTACLDVPEKKLRKAVAIAGTNPLFVRRALERGLFKVD